MMNLWTILRCAHCNGHLKPTLRLFEARKPKDISPLNIMAAVDISNQVDPFFLALSRARRRRFDDCVEICSDILEKNPYDQVSL